MKDAKDILLKTSSKETKIIQITAFDIQLQKGIPEGTITIDGITYKITIEGKNAFLKDPTEKNFTIFFYTLPKKGGGAQKGGTPVPPSETVTENRRNTDDETCSCGVCRFNCNLIENDSVTNVECCESLCSILSSLCGFFSS